MAKKEPDKERYPNVAREGEQWRHQYPTNCPQCSADLVERESVLIFFQVAGMEVVKKSQLGQDGVLEDVESLIARGYHSDTFCIKCNTSLAYHEILE